MENLYKIYNKQLFNFHEPKWGSPLQQPISKLGLKKEA